MKKILSFSIAALTILLLNLFGIKNSYTEEYREMRWDKVYCLDGVNSYEICRYSGDGFTCSEWYARTRLCPESSN